ncbi:PPOX class F420-dependent oxidoreductase [Dactylosporangium sp. CA-233914]|uniref:PPOX class F420-dependent oxidoreductase n=1 Tax=Dactylosporangium sp. CA-233914 TaxID=3239934 RepID=UPI003D8C88B7
MDLPTPLRDLLEGAGLCYLTTLMPDGSPQITQVWVDTDGKNILVNTVRGHQKTRNVARDPRVAVAIGDPAQPRRYFQVRGRVIAVTEQGAAEHIEALAHRYLGTPYPWFGGRDQVRLLLTIEPEHITGR